ncbi:hypothetical protein [Seohaeicola zhoushanensis]|uniref:Uncharacterized protein n=1 Tax=Seohaeicola zhoushanensis TaxID=1569283 RepID=A0A8J3H3T2_9RHOB|nr:hypothetical protein [Seohaeicola zhoushanensis]GHF73295.1 hypothetical protein GCM10017056_50140 [Seohaeicola zhoushanensis]
MKVLADFAVVVVAYILAHGIIALLVTPLQMRVLPEITPFASLIYLPHGVRVLTTWLLGRVAFAPLCLGAFLAEVIFTPPEVSLAARPTIMMSIAVGAFSALLAFEVMKMFGHDLYAGGSLRIHWKWLLIVGILASIFNSIGQAVVFSGTILSEHSLAVLLTYAVGDTIGLVATTLVLMLVFRWLRRSAKRG